MKGQFTGVAGTGLTGLFWGRKPVRRCTTLRRVWEMVWYYAQKNIYEILLNRPEIRLYLSFSDGFGSKRTFVSIQINRKMVNTIWFRFDLIRFRKKFAACARICILAAVSGTKEIMDKLGHVMRALSTLRGLRGAPEVPPLCQETQSLGQKMLELSCENATVGKNGLSGTEVIPLFYLWLE